MMSVDAETSLSTPHAAPPRPVVLADDDDQFRQTIAELLEDRGFVVHQAANGLEAILAIKELRPSAVVLDLFMPRLGGLETLNRIRAFDPTIRIVVVTGVADRAVHRQALLLGATALFTKPIVVEDLVELLSGPTIGSDAARHDRPKRQGGTSDRSVGPVLIVDDEPDIREVLGEFLGREGFLTQAASDGRTAIKLVSEERPPVVLLDVVMPNLEGLEALMLIRGIAPETRVIMISGKATLDVAKRALAYGAFDFLEKPLDMRHLGEVVAAAFVQPWK